MGEKGVRTIARGMGCVRTRDVFVWKDGREKRADIPIKS